MPMTPHEAALLEQRTQAIDQGLIDHGQAATIAQLQALRSEFASDRRWRERESHRLKWRVAVGVLVGLLIGVWPAFIAFKIIDRIAYTVIPVMP